MILEAVEHAHKYAAMFYIPYMTFIVDDWLEQGTKSFGQQVVTLLSSKHALEF